MNPVCCTVDTCEVSCTTCNCCGTRVCRRRASNEEESSTLPLADSNEVIVGEEKVEKAKIETWSTDSLSSSVGDIAPSDNNDDGKNNSFVSSKVSSVPSIFGLGNSCGNNVNNNNEVEAKFYPDEEIQSTGRLQVRRRSSLFKANSCPVIFVNDRRLSLKSTEDLRESKERLVREWLATQPTPGTPQITPKKRIKSGKSRTSSKNSRESIALAEVFPGLTQDELDPDEESLDDFFGPRKSPS